MKLSALDFQNAAKRAEDVKTACKRRVLSLERLAAFAERTGDETTFNQCRDEAAFLRRLL